MYYIRYSKTLSFDFFLYAIDVDNQDDNQFEDNPDIGVTGFVKKTFRKVFGQSPDERAPNTNGRSLCKNDNCEYPFDKWYGYQIQDGACPRCCGVYSAQ